MEILLILFIILAILTLLGTLFLYLFKNIKYKNILFYLLSFLSLIITFINATSLPSNYITEQVIAWLIGLVTLVSLAIKIKSPEKVNLAYLLVSISSLLGLLNLLII